jgi:hypothetical protein
MRFVGAGVGKYHTILVADDGRAYASGGNLCGQLGINNEKVRGVEKFRRCVVAGGGGVEEDGGVEDGGGVRIVQVSFFVGRTPPPPWMRFLFPPEVSPPAGAVSVRDEPLSAPESPAPSITS